MKVSKQEMDKLSKMLNSFEAVNSTVTPKMADSMNCNGGCYGACVTWCSGTCVGAACKGMCTRWSR